MKISEEVRAAAIEVLDLGAGSTDRNALSSPEVYAQAPDYPGPGVAFSAVDQPIAWLVSEAWCRVLGVDAVSCAAAAGLLRDGWSPGDEIVHILPGDL